MKISIICSVLVCLLIGTVRTAYSGYGNKIQEECDEEKYVKGEDGSCCPKPVSKDHTKYDCFFFDPTCWVHCDEGYAFPDTHNTTKIIECREGQWMSWTEDSLYSGIPCEKNLTGNDSVESTGGSTAPDTGRSNEPDLIENTNAVLPMCDDLPRIKNAVLQCSLADEDTTWKCVATCKENYILSNGKTQVEYMHEGGVWKMKGSDQLIESMKSCFESSVTSPPPTLPQPEHLRDSERRAKPKEGECKGRPIPPEDTIGMVRIHTKQGLCENTEALKGMVSCAGTCHSTATYAPSNAGVQQTSSYCTCCQAKPEEDKAVMVLLKCEKQSRLMRRSIQIPTGCQCGPCTASQVVTTTEEPAEERVEGCPENVC